MTRLLSRLIAAGFGLVVATVAFAQSSERFDLLVRGDMFAGFEGDEEAFDRALALCEKRLADNPNHAQALVWHGAATFFRGGRALAAGGRDQALAFFRQGSAEMNRAVALSQIETPSFSLRTTPTLRPERSEVPNSPWRASPIQER